MLLTQLGNILHCILYRECMLCCIAIYQEIYTIESSQVGLSLCHRKLKAISESTNAAIYVFYYVLNQFSSNIKYLIAKKVQTSAMKTCFQIAECSLSSANIQQYSETTNFSSTFLHFEGKLCPLPLNIRSTTMAMAPSPITLQAVPKLSMAI